MEIILGYDNKDGKLKIRLLLNFISESTKKLYKNKL